MSSEGQNNLDTVLKTQGNGEVRYLAPAASSTTDINPWDRSVEMTCPASGTATLKMPGLGDVEDGAEFLFFTRGTAGTGQISLKSAGDQQGETGTPVDIIGDNFSAALDYAIAKKVGKRWVVVKEVTT